jgi:hypothetical protein
MATSTTPQPYAADPPENPPRAWTLTPYLSRGTGSLQTHRWRKADSNCRCRAANGVNGDRQPTHLNHDDAPGFYADSAPEEGEFELSVPLDTTKVSKPSHLASTISANEKESGASANRSGKYTSGFRGTGSSIWLPRGLTFQQRGPRAQARTTARQPAKRISALSVAIAK